MTYFFYCVNIGQQSLPYYLAIDQSLVSFHPVNLIPCYGIYVKTEAIAITVSQRVLAGYLIIGLLTIISGTCCFADVGISPDQHTLYAPLPLVSGFVSAEIAVANRTNHSIEATLVLYGDDGKELVSEPLHFISHQVQRMVFSDILKGLDISYVANFTSQRIAICGLD